MIIVGAKDLGPTKHIYEYIKNLKEVYWIQTNLNGHNHASKKNFYSAIRQ